MVARGDVIWTPSPERIAAGNWSRFAASAVGEYGAPSDAASDSTALHRWSIADPGAFWAAIWDLGGLGPHRGPFGDLSGGVAAAPSFFPDGRVNVAEVLLGEPTDHDALVVIGEDGARRVLTRRRLSDAVRAAAGALSADGVRPGDRVVAVVPYSIESVVIGLAAAAVGATFASASPDFGEDALVDRFGQLDPTVLVASGRHSYAGRQHDTSARAATLAERLGVRRGVMIAAEPTAAGGTWLEWDAWLGGATPCAEFELFPFDHPWYVLFSSGTTGKPKAIVHRAGGVLLKHLSEHTLHSDIRRGDVVFQFTTTGWMMWNWAVSALAAGATVVSYDGSPFHPGPTALWDVIDAERVTLFGTSAKYLDECAKVGLEPRLSHRLESLRTISSTGSPLSIDRFAWVYAAVAPDTHLASISGGTDLCGCLVAGYPTEQVRAGVIQGPALGVAADVVDDDGSPAVEQQGELVVDRPFPSQPLGFVGDTDGSRYRSAYYERFPGRWHQGDRTTRTADGGFVIHGRSDATLNPGGVRIGTAEIYRTVDRHPEVVDSIAVPRVVGDDQVIVLFVRLRDGCVLDDELIADLRARIRSELSPRHVPAAIGQVNRIPRTKSGKLVEIAVRTIVNGGTVAETGALDDASALDEFVDHPCLASL
ncbi:MAG TPA: acetoacetate--CoA ligase [Ilumatobacteraceae bacterium]|nr:acetoacetate--CoA ligase [Ilumatobacteraceae bacterium]